MNRVTIQPCQFTDVRKVGTENRESYGVRVYDDGGQAYVNLWEDIPDDDMEVLKRVLQSSDETIIGIMDYVSEYEKGLIIGDTWYEWEKIKSYFAEREHQSQG